MKKNLMICLLGAAMFGLASCGGSTGSAATSTPVSTPASSAVSEEVVEGAIDYAAFAVAEAGTTVTVVSYIQDKEGFWTDTTTGKGTATLYTQDQDGAYFSYNAHMDEEVYNKLTVGTRVKMTGEISNYSGEHELTDAEVTIVSGAPYVASPLDITSLFGTNKLMDHMNQYVTMTGGKVVAFSEGSDAAWGYKWNGSGEAGDDVYFNVAFGDAVTLSCNVRHYLRGADTDVYKAATALAIGDSVTLTGFLYWYNTAAQPRITSIVK